MTPRPCRLASVEDAGGGLARVREIPSPGGGGAGEVDGDGRYGDATGGRVPHCLLVGAGACLVTSAQRPLGSVLRTRPAGHPGNGYGDRVGSARATYARATYAQDTSVQVTSARSTSGPTAFGQVTFGRADGHVAGIPALPGVITRVGRNVRTETEKSTTDTRRPGSPAWRPPV